MNSFWSKIPKHTRKHDTMNEKQKGNRTAESDPQILQILKIISTECNMFKEIKGRLETMSQELETSKLSRFEKEPIEFL